MFDPVEHLETGEPARPRPAASIVLLRPGSEQADGQLEVLLAQRTWEARFMPGVWVFPGGALDECDCGELRACAVRELREEVGIELPAGRELVPFAHWITPEMLSVRFDAWFYLALAPPHSPLRPDGREAVDARWITPHAALEASAAGDLSLAFPTIRQLEALSGHRSAGEAIEAHRERPVEPVLPKPVDGPGGDRLSLPGDPDYPG